MSHKEPTNQVGRTTTWSGCKLHEPLIFQCSTKAAGQHDCPVCVCTACIHMCVFTFPPMQAGHDSRPTAPEQPNQDLFLPLPTGLLQPGQKELHSGVRMGLYTWRQLCSPQFHSSKCRMWFVLKIIIIIISMMRYAVGCELTELNHFLKCLLPCKHLSVLEMNIL